MLKRRTLLAGSTAAALAAPGIGRSQGRQVLRFVPRSDLGLLDPVWTTANVTRNHGYLVYDTLFGRDAGLATSPQMLQGHGTEDGGRRWELRLREGLLWHDGQRVLARDCVASIRRWGARDPFGQALLATTDELAASDDQTIVFRLKHPFPLLPAALGKSSSYMPAMMPERIASVGPGQQVTEIIGSGPFRFKADERVPGAKAVYERFEGYVPQPNGTPSMTAGPKRVHFDRVEWITMADPGTAAAALRAGEVDWWDYPIVDLIPMLKRQRGVVTRVLDPNGQIPVFRPNHLEPPFNNPAIRRALLRGLDWSEFMTAVAGDDPALWTVPVGLFCPRTPMAVESGMAALRAPRNVGDAKREMQAAGYKGEPVAMLVASDFPALSAMSDVGADNLRKMGMNVDCQTLDWGTVQQRRVKKGPVNQGGWSCFFTIFDGSDLIDPVGHLPLRGNGSNAWFGWPDIPDVERLRSEWLDAPDVSRQRDIAAEMQRVAFETVPYVPLGQFFQQTAYRSDLQDMIDGFPVFWGVRRA